MHERDLALRTAHGLILMYSITSKDSFTEVSSYRDQILRCRDVSWFPCILVGNKCDLEDQREVSRQEGEELARLFMIPFLETSAKSRINIDEIFFLLTRIIKTPVHLFDLKRQQQSLPWWRVMEKRNLSRKIEKLQHEVDSYELRCKISQLKSQLAALKYPLIEPTILLDANTLAQDLSKLLEIASCFDKDIISGMMAKLQKQQTVTSEGLTLVDFMKSLLKDKESSDVTFVLDTNPTKKIYVHKCILQVRCEYFAGFFNWKAKVGNESEEQYNISTKSIGSTKVFRALIEYLYTGDFSLFLTPSKLALLMALANEYQLPRLKHLCAEQLRRYLTKDTVIDCYQGARLHLCEQLAQCCVYEISKPEIYRHVKHKLKHYLSEGDKETVVSNYAKIKEYRDRRELLSMEIAEFEHRIKEIQ